MSLISPVASPAFDVQGHRGARGLMPENTIPAFLKALELGVTTLEMDVVISADSQVVVSHEPWFSGLICSLPSGEPVPLSGERSYRIYAMPYAEVARFDCGSRGHPNFPEQRRMKAAKPLLREVIAAAEAYTQAHGLPPVQYNIETKSTPEGDGHFHPPPDVFTRLLYEVVKEAGIADRTILQSFDVRTLQYARAAGLPLRLALLVEARGDPGLAANLARLGFTPDIYSPDFRLVDEALVEAVHARGMQLIPWTVNDVEAMRRLKALGVDGLITDYPDRARFLLEADR
ncbi:glycerophosphodiester phosphodiesterase [Rhodocaloribacter litoris]|uniref:glycerophosphodiester phosphodiesterase n=1 Tax=Rhodocaloribacter litoris TaxID=2558931 RepID=UPI00141E1CCF|nr:glycerophosphodiester phosphodiesterase [Rhodocaloribacter litoris]QXD14265.1 glycerophosphodiester phosphodiesterase [Rhodocaloribacter litoris]